MSDQYFRDIQAFREGNTLMRVSYIIKWIVIGVVMACAFAFLFSFFVKLIWNAVIPDIFGLPQITFWQAFGLTVLIKLLFGGGFHKHPKRHIHQKSCKDIKDLRSADFRKFWEEDGRMLFEEYMKKRKETVNTES